MQGMNRHLALLSCVGLASACVPAAEDPCAGAPCGDDDDDSAPGPRSVPALVINEFMASNLSSYAPAVGEFPDWIELYNPGDVAVDLQGFLITDDMEEPDKHAFVDSLLVPAGGFVLLRATGEQSDDPAELPFKLSAAGEEIGLFEPEGQLPLDQVAFGPQTADIAAARAPDGGGTWVYVGGGTPRTANAAR
jgi:hypothetical protein